LAPAVKKQLVWRRISGPCDEDDRQAPIPTSTEEKCLARKKKRLERGREETIPPLRFLWNGGETVFPRLRETSCLLSPVPKLAVSWPKTDHMEDRIEPSWNDFFDGTARKAMV
jgi:hypothetical protein